MSYKKIFLFLFFILLPTFSFAAEKSLYDLDWLGKDKKIFVLENRYFKKDGRFSLAAGGGVTTSGAFVDSFNLGARASYFFSEQFGAEFFYHTLSGKENETARTVRNHGGAGSIPFRIIIQNYYGGLLLWSPFYAKMNIFNLIVYFDWIFGAGMATLSQTNNKLEVATGGRNKTETIENHSGFAWSIGIKFYLTKMFSIRTDLTAIHFNGPKSSTGDTLMYSHYDATVMLQMSF